MSKMAKKIVIFDTTLRDGEQSPGASLTIQEKLIIAKQLARLNVDVIEAGFPISSQGDVEAVRHAKKYCDDVEFSPEDAARTDLDYMCDVVRAAVKAGATTINIPDTVGYAEPEEFGKRIKYLFEKVPEAHNIVISCHCHDDLGLAVANSLAAIQ